MLAASCWPHQHLAGIFQGGLKLIGGGDASASEANMALEQAQGIDPATES